MGYTSTSQPVGQDLLWVEQPFHRDCLKPAENTDTCITICSGESSTWVPGTYISKESGMIKWKPQLSLQTLPLQKVYQNWEAGLSFHRNSRDSPWPRATVKQEGKAGGLACPNFKTPWAQPSGQGAATVVAGIRYVEDYKSGHKLHIWIWFIFNSGAKGPKFKGSNSLVNKHFWQKWISTFGEIKLDPLPHITHKINLKLTKEWNREVKTIRILGVQKKTS